MQQMECSQYACYAHISKLHIIAGVGSAAALKFIYVSYTCFTYLFLKQGSASPVVE